jgi:hypothetical protein
MANVLSKFETYTIGYIQTLIEKEEKRKAQCKAAYARFIAKHKEAGTFTEKRLCIIRSIGSLK